MALIIRLRAAGKPRQTIALYHSSLRQLAHESRKTAEVWIDKNQFLSFRIFGFVLFLFNTSDPLSFRAFSCDYEWSGDIFMHFLIEPISKLLNGSLGFNTYISASRAWFFGQT